MAVAVSIAEAVLVGLNGHTFSQPLTAERQYRPQFELPDMKTLRVSVVPRALKTSGGTRGQAGNECAVDVAVQKKLDTEENAEIDPLIGLVEEIADFVRTTRRFATFPDAVWVRTENDPLYSLEHLEELRQFTSVLTFTFQLLR